MPFSVIPLKVKIIGIAILAVMVFALVGTALEAFNQYQSVQDGAAAAQTQYQPYHLAVPAAQDDDPGGNAAVRTFMFFCPFH